jgi:pantetheine-phosphate adenylyltransferase
MKSTLGIYAGSFLPFHVGHMDIVNQAKEIFNELLIAQCINPEKMDIVKSEYSLPSEIFSKYPNIKTSLHNSLLIDLIKDKEYTHNVTLIRGLRNGTDLDYEQNFVAFLKGMHPTAKIVAFYCDPKHRHISSGALRSLRKFSETEYKKYIFS